MERKKSGRLVDWWIGGLADLRIGWIGGLEQQAKIVVGSGFFSVGRVGGGQERRGERERERERERGERTRETE